MNRAKAVILLTICGLVIVAALVLLLMNMPADWKVQLFSSRTFVFSRAVWMLLNAAAGVGIYLVLRRLLPAGLQALRAANAAQQMSEVKKLAQAQAKAERKDQAGQA